MNALFLFENYPLVPQNFYDRQIVPSFRRRGIAYLPTFKFVDYLDRTAFGKPPLNTSIIAQNFFRAWESLKPEPLKTALVLDLDPTGSESPDLSFGLCVLLEIARQLGGIQALLKHPSFLIVILTAVGDHSIPKPDGIARLNNPSCDLSALKSIWPHVKKIVKQGHGKVTKDELTRVINLVHEETARIVYAYREEDDAWLSEVLVEWFI